MRKPLLAVVIFAAAGIATTLTTSTPAAAAHGYPWCVQGWGVGVPGDCSYRTYAQCAASASGRNAWCAQNPSAAAVQGKRVRGPNQ